MLKTRLTVIIFLAMIASCKQEEKPLTKEEVLDFAKKIEISIGEKNATVLNEAVDGNALMEKMDIGSGSDSRSFQSGIKEKMQMGSKIIESLTEKGSYSFIKYYEKDKIHHILFRLYDNGSLNYHDYELKRTGGQPKIADIYIYTSGENLSETLKNLFAQFKNEFDRETSNEMDWINRMAGIRSLIVKGKNREALEIYNTIPINIKRGKVFQVVHIEICSGLSEEEYSNAITEYETLYPNEPNMHLLLIDGYVLRKDYARALNSVNELDKMIDKDPLLDFYRAMCHSLLNETDKKIACLERLVKSLPDFEDGLLELIAEYLDSDQLEKAKPLVDRFKSKSEFNQSVLTLLLTEHPSYNEKWGNQ